MCSNVTKATALKFFGIPCVIASSFSETYKRNAFNNGFVVFECPQLIKHLRAPSVGERLSSDPTSAKSRLCGDIEIDYRRSVVRIGGALGQEFPFPALSPSWLRAGYV